MYVRERAARHRCVYCIWIGRQLFRIHTLHTNPCAILYYAVRTVCCILYSYTMVRWHTISSLLLAIPDSRSGSLLPKQKQQHGRACLNAVVQHTRSYTPYPFTTWGCAHIQYNTQYTYTHTHSQQYP